MVTNDNLTPEQRQHAVGLVTYNEYAGLYRLWFAIASGAVSNERLDGNKAIYNYFGLYTGAEVTEHTSAMIADLALYYSKKQLLGPTAVLALIGERKNTMTTNSVFVDGEYLRHGYTAIEIIIYQSEAGFCLGVIAFLLAAWGRQMALVEEREGQIAAFTLVIWVICCLTLLHAATIVAALKN